MVRIIVLGKEDGEEGDQSADSAQDSAHLSRDFKTSLYWGCDVTKYACWRRTHLSVRQKLHV